MYLWWLCLRYVLHVQFHARNGSDAAPKQDIGVARRGQKALEPSLQLARRSLARSLAGVITLQQQPCSGVGRAQNSAPPGYFAL